MKILLIGYGKMGKAVEAAALQRGHSIVGRIADPDMLHDHVLQEADVAIEFTAPEAAFHNLIRCFTHGLPVVCGTTGWLSQQAELDVLCQKMGGTYLQSSNFSIGVQLYLAIVRKATAIMQHSPSFKASVTETHHTEKKDMPSGTALLIQQAMAEASPIYKEWHLTNHGSGDGLPITSVREEEVPGTHTITFQSENDEIYLTHQAFNRKGFAMGAVVAAEWIMGRKGVFTMRDVLGI